MFTDIGDSKEERKKAKQERAALTKKNKYEKLSDDEDGGNTQSTDEDSEDDTDSEGLSEDDMYPLEDGSHVLPAKIGDIKMKQQIERRSDTLRKRKQ